MGAGRPIKEIPRRHTHPAAPPGPATEPSAPQDDPLLDLAGVGRRSRWTLPSPILNFAGQGFTGVNPPDTVGDVGLDHYIQAINTQRRRQLHGLQQGRRQRGRRPHRLDTLGTAATAPAASATRSCSTTSWPTAGCSASSQQRQPPLRLRLADQQPRQRRLVPLPVHRAQLPRLPEVRRLAGRLLRLQPTRPAPPPTPSTATSMLPGLSAHLPALHRARPRRLRLPGADPGRPRRQPRRRRPARPASSCATATTRSTTRPATPARTSSRSGSSTSTGRRPANSTFTGPTNIADHRVQLRAVRPHLVQLLPAAGRRPTLDPLREVVMFRLQYRNFGTPPDAGRQPRHRRRRRAGRPAERGGIRWFELRKTGGGWSAAPGGHLLARHPPPLDGQRPRMDGSGNIARRLQRLEHHASSRACATPAGSASDPPGTLAGRGHDRRRHGLQLQQPLGRLRGAERGPGRRLHLLVHGRVLAGASSWSTRIATFKFAACGGAPTPDFTVSCNPATVSAQQGAAGPAPAPSRRRTASPAR